MNLLFIGLGSIGQRHANLIFKHFPEYEIYALRSERTENNFSFVCNLYDWTEVDLINFEAAFICNPTNQHIESAIQCAMRDMSLFIEKPLSNGMNRIDELKHLVFGKKLTCYVAYPFRHHPDIKVIKRSIGNDSVKIRFECITWLPAWGKSYSMKRETGGGALLELSHEIDMAQYLCGKIEQTEGRFGQAYDVTSDCEDWANLTLFHETGNESRIYLDLGSKAERRTVEVMTNNYHCIYDLRASRNMFYERMYLNQLQYFFRNLNNLELDNNLFEAAELFEKIVEFRGE